MKFLFRSLLIVFTLVTLFSCEEIISKGFDNNEIKKVRTENTSLKIRIDKLQRDIKEKDTQLETNNLLISMYDLRHAVEKYYQSNRDEYPVAEDIDALRAIVNPFLPEEYNIEKKYLETIKSTKKGYIFIANINNQKIVISNLI